MTMTHITPLLESLESREHFAGDIAGNTFDAAKDLGFPGGAERRYTDKLPGKDKDFFRFRVDRTRELTLRASSGKADLELKLFNAKRREMATSDEPGKSAEVISGTLRPGTYFIKLCAHGKGKAPYAMELSAKTRPFIGTVTPPANDPDPVNNPEPEPQPQSNIPLSGAYSIQVSSGGTYGDDALLGNYLIKGLAGRTGLVVINPTLAAANLTNGNNGREVGFYLSDNLFSRVPGMGPGGDAHFATNTTLHRQVGVSHASTLFAGAVDETPENRDIAYVTLNEGQRQVVIDVDQYALGSTGQRNWFIKSDGSLLTVSGPLPVTGGRVVINFSEDGRSLWGSAYFTGVDNAGWSFGQASFYVEFWGNRLE